jgi:phage anti-repressor protein
MNNNFSIEIIEQQIDSETVKTISARELHQKLEVKKDFSSWIKYQIKKAMLTENMDFITTHQKRGVANGGHKMVLEYYLTIDSAKHIALMSGTIKGRDIRNYFIEVEKKYREELYNKQDSFQERKEQFQLDVIGLESSFKLLRVNEASKIGMTHKLYKEHGLSTSYLPKYSDEQHTYFLSHLLKKYEVGISAKKLNLILLSEGYLEIKTRKSTGSTIKTFKSLTEKGLGFGKNVISPHNQLETSPHYFENRFRKLIEVLKI